MSEALLSDLLAYYGDEAASLGVQQEMPLRGKQHVQEQLRALGYAE